MILSVAKNFNEVVVDDINSEWWKLIWLGSVRGACIILSCF